jgi:hypothetical protein
LPTGALDTSVGSGGFVTAITLPGVTALGVQSDSKIVAAGDNALERVDADGTLDASYGTAGVAPVSLSINALRMQVDDEAAVERFAP